MKKITSLIMLFVVGYFLNFISGNIIVTIIGCLLLGIMLGAKKQTISFETSFLHTPPSNNFTMPFMWRDNDSRIGILQKMWFANERIVNGCFWEICDRSYTLGR